MRVKKRVIGCCSQVLTKANIDTGQQKSHTRTERRVLGTINHPFIVKLYYAFQVLQLLSSLLLTAFIVITPCSMRLLPRRPASSCF
jgi:hypothetical protein